MVSGSLASVHWDWKKPGRSLAPEPATQPRNDGGYCPVTYLLPSAICHQGAELSRTGRIVTRHPPPCSRPRTPQPACAAIRGPSFFFPNFPLQVSAFSFQPFLFQLSAFQNFSVFLSPSPVPPHASRLTPHASRITHHASRITSHVLPPRPSFPYSLSCLPRRSSCEAGPFRACHGVAHAKPGV
jgi:hypothetical protein